MKTRREMLHESARALPGLALPERVADPACRPPGRGRNADRFPNYLLETHDGRRVRFYDDVILASASVFVHFFSVYRESDYPVIANLQRVAGYLGDRLGTEVTFHSLTADPEHDTPRELRKFADRMGLGEGWSLLTGDPDDLDDLRYRLYTHGGGMPHGSHDSPDCSLGLGRYGNEALGIWGAVPTRAEPDWIARRLDWIRPRETRTAAQPSRRRGPHPDTYRT